MTMMMIERVNRVSLGYAVNMDDGDFRIFRRGGIRCEVSAGADSGVDVGMDVILDVDVVGRFFVPDMVGS